MPPKSTGGKLADDKIAILTEWVKMGAPDPRVGSSQGDCVQDVRADGQGTRTLGVSTAGKA
jgi:hypothetical protein